MKTTYLFIIILVFSMISPYAFACGEGSGEGGSGLTIPVSTGAMSAAPTISFYTPPNAVQCSWNIQDAAQRELDKQKADPGRVDKHIQGAIRSLADQSKRTKNIRTMVAYIKLLMLTQTGSRGEHRITMAMYALAVLLANDRAHSYN